MHESSNMAEPLVAEIAKLAHMPGKATTHGPACDTAFAPISTAALDEAVRELGLRLPPILRRLYTEVGNGGFGPGHGLLSMVALSTVDRPIPLYYSRLRTNRADWPLGVVPFCDWGSLVVTCVDLTNDDDDPPVLRFEPNMSHADTVPFWKGMPIRATGIIPESKQLSAWFAEWISGREMFERPYLMNE